MNKKVFELYKYIFYRFRSGKCGIVVYVVRIDGI